MVLVLSPAQLADHAVAVLASLAIHILDVSVSQHGMLLKPCRSLAPLRNMAIQAPNTLPQAGTTAIRLPGLCCMHFFGMTDFAYEWLLQELSKAIAFLKWFWCDYFRGGSVICVVRGR